jgi:hypothetical protein
MAGAFPISVSELTRERLTELMRTIDGLETVDGFTVTDSSQFDDGQNKVSTAGRIELDLDISAPGRAARREKAIIKICRPDIAAQPLYRNEVAFYTRVRPELDIETPRAMGGEFDEASGTFGLALEDLRERGASFPNVKTPVMLPHMRSLLDALSSLHAHFWQSERLLGELDFVQPHTSGELWRFFNNPDAVPALVRYEVAHEQFKREMVQAAGRTVDDLYREFRRLQTHQATLPFTLCHGDTHIGNTYVLPDGRAGLLDWQLMARGYCMHDVTYVLVTGLTVADRRAHERNLIAYYLEQLAAKGVTNPPTLEEAWHEHRLAAAWGVFIGWLTTSIDNYGWDITVCNHLRLFTAYNDLGSVELLAELPDPPPYPGQ